MIEQLYQERCRQITDINEHLPILRDLASQVDHVTEFGVREGHSTVAFAAALPGTLISYDIDQMPPILGTTIMSYMPSFCFIQANVLDVEIEPTDLLFIDSYHTYEHLNRELEIHSGKVKRFIAFHDTEAFGNVGEDGSRPGLRQAIEELVDNSEWEVYADLKNNNGLMVISK